MRFFFYGTLMDPDVLAAVLGRAIAGDALRKGLLPGYRRHALTGRSYPVALRAPGALTEGLVADGIDELEAARLAFYESADYAIVAETVMVEGRKLRAIIFAAERANFDVSSDGWSLPMWQRLHKAEFLPRVRAIMAKYRADAHAPRNWPTTD